MKAVGKHFNHNKSVCPSLVSVPLLTLSLRFSVSLSLCFHPSIYICRVVVYLYFYISINQCIFFLLPVSHTSFCFIFYPSQCLRPYFLFLSLLMIEIQIAGVMCCNDMDEWTA